jgi:hypothetical protein
MILYLFNKCPQKVFLNFLTSGMADRERHDKMMNEIQKLEYKVDSIQIKCDSLQNILKYNYESNRHR